MAEASLGVYVFLFLALYFEVFLLITFFERRYETQSSRRELSRFPSVAVIVPCFNEERTVGKTIESLLSLDYPKDKLSIVVVDDGSTDSTLAVARAFERFHNVTVHTKRNGGKHTALNYALRRTSAEIVGCLDADSWAEPMALREIIHAFDRDTALMAVTPAIKVNRPRRFLEIVQKAEYALSVFSRKMFGNLGALFVTPGPFSFYRREVFDNVGLFRMAHHTEDMEMALRMQAHHLKITNVNTAHVYTTVPATLRGLIRQRARWTRGFIENSKDYAHLYFNRRYGALGLFVLPTGMVAIFSALYLAGYFLWSWIAYGVDLLARVGAVGVGNTISTSHLDWYFLNTSTYMFVIVTLIAFTLFVIMVGKRLGAERMVSRDIVYYVLCYGLIAPLWLATAVIESALARRVSWR